MRRNVHEGAWKRKKKKATNIRRTFVSFVAIVVLLQVAFLMGAVGWISPAVVVFHQQQCFILNNCDNLNKAPVVVSRVSPHELVYLQFPQRNDSESLIMLEEARRQLTRWYPSDEVEFQPCFDQSCKISEDRVWAYNPWERSVYLCGKTIEPYKAKEVNCNESPRVYDEKQSLVQVDLYPKEEDTRHRDFPYLEFPNCSVPCRFVDIGGHPIELVVKGTNWKIWHTMESPVHYKKTAVKEYGWKNNTYYSTTSLKSEIPIPYFWMGMEIKTPPVDYDSVIKGASFIAGNCGNIKNNRTAIVQELIDMNNIIRVDSLGDCLRNAKPPEGANLGNKEDLQRHYLFHLAFENANAMDHVTEKMWGTLFSGTLPVYMGAPNIKELVPENSIISWHDFNSTRELGEYLQVVAANKTLYESYHKWRFEPTLPQRFLNTYNFSHEHACCRTCKWAHAKQRGLGWSHEQQEMRPLYKSRRLCLDNSASGGGGGVIVEPFREVVVEATAPTAVANQSHCHENLLPTLELLGSNNNLRRTVSHHDGVVDIFLEGASSEPYRILTGMESQLRRVKDNLYLMQDEVSRITFVVDSTIEVSSSEKVGTVSFRSHRGATLSGGEGRIRVIMEDVDRFHKGADKLMSYYGKVMVDQFEAPLQYFKAVTLKSSTQ